MKDFCLSCLPTEVIYATNVANSGPQPSSVCEPDPAVTQRMRTRIESPRACAAVKHRFSTATKQSASQLVLQLLGNKDLGEDAF